MKKLLLTLIALGILAGGPITSEAQATTVKKIGHGHKVKRTRVIVHRKHHDHHFHRRHRVHYYHPSHSWHHHHDHYVYYPTCRLRHYHYH